MLELPKKPNLEEINYILPNERIAKYPLDERSDSKLLTYLDKSISHNRFYGLPDLLSENDHLFFNNTKVIPARLFFKKDTGAVIEIFLLTPIAPSNIMSIVMEAHGSVSWKCMIGNLKKWKDNTDIEALLNDEYSDIGLKAKLVDRASGIVELNWQSQHSFAELVELAGTVPLPPYLNREAEPEDKNRYQTVYSKEEGAVAAPTAGLHFTDEVLGNLQKKGVGIHKLTLHVSAGTFQPIKVEDAREHPMHSEQMEVNKESIASIINSDKIIAVGTTSMRTLESLYWFGVRLLKGNEEFAIEKLELYQSATELPSRKVSFQAIYNWMIEKGINKVHGSTEIFIMPGYKFKVCDGLITNFHQPGSTLLLLIAAFVGDDWKNLYQEALSNNYRFLSYGDSSILIP